MKALRYLLLVLGLVSVLSICAQNLAQKPEAQMQSTSVMQGAGSRLPQAAVEGVTTTQNYSPGRPGHVRKGLDDDDEDKTKPGQPFPLGDGWPLAGMLGVYCAYVMVRARVRARAHARVRARRRRETV